MMLFPLTITSTTTCSVAACLVIPLYAFILFRIRNNPKMVTVHILIILLLIS